MPACIPRQALPHRTLPEGKLFNQERSNSRMNSDILIRTHRDEWDEQDAGGTAYRVASAVRHGIKPWDY
jgi:hypothetical protein